MGYLDRVYPRRSELRRENKVETLSRERVLKREFTAHKMKIGSRRATIKIIPQKRKFTGGGVHSDLVRSSGNRVGRVDMGHGAVHGGRVRVANLSSR